MSPLNRGPLLGPRVPPAGLRHLPPPRFGGRLPPPGLPPRMPPPPINPVFGPMRQRLLPPPPPRPGGISRPGGPLPLFGPRGRGMAPLVPPMGPRGTGPRGPLMRPWSRRVLPPQILPHMRARFSIGNGTIKGKPMNNAKKVNKLEELELKKPWMTDEIRNEIQKKNRLYAKAKKNKDAKEWEDFKDLRNKVTRMIRDAKNEYLAKHPEQAHLHPDDEENEDQRDENCVSSEDDTSYYCEVCDRDFPSEDNLSEHKSTHKLCGIDGCTFSAHPLLVEKHITMQHSTGLYQRMKNLSTPEDIEKWIMERKKRYPTKANIELKRAEELEKVQRGEIIKQNHNAAQTKRKKVTNIREKRRKPRRRLQQVFHDNSSHPKEIYRGLPAFRGTMSLQKMDSNVPSLDNDTVNKNTLEENMKNISDEEDIPSIPLRPTVTNLQVSGLVANYGSDSEDDEAPEEMPFKKVRTVNTEESNETVNPTVSPEVPATAQLGINNQKQSNRKSETSQKSQNTQRTECNTFANERNQTRTKKHPERLQLLQKLLSRSIQHERNLICQCVKYIVDNNFFD